MKNLIRLESKCLLAGLAVLAGMMARAAGQTSEISVTLGPRNQPAGLTVPSAGDGINVPEVVSGAPARRIKGGESPYLYVIVDHPDYARGPRDVYVTVEVLDDAFGRLALQYDKASATPNLGTKYTDSGHVMLLTGSMRWRRGVFPLRGLRLGHGQNQGADFRLVAPSVAVRKITLGPVPPAGYDPDHPIDREALHALSVNRPPGMALTLGNDANPDDAAIYKALSVTSVESYVDWAGVEPREGQWDWSRWDKQVATLRKAGLKWVPFLIAGPAYATPLWFQNGPESRVYRCLEHSRDSKVQSLFNPLLRRRIERFLDAFAARYRDSGVIESVLLGITGIYGESIYPAGPEGGWTAGLTGHYHNHGGWWAGDALAVAAFRQAMQARYTSIAALNRAWNTSHRSFDDVKPFLPSRATDDRARADFVEWYQDAMTDWAVFWAKAARAVLPRTDIYLCTGGDGNPMLGADFTAQVAAIAGLGAGVRITNEGSDYAANFTLTREVATATRLYHTYCGFEPASAVDAGGVIARIYNSTASGARQLHDYAPNTLGQGSRALANLRSYLPMLVPRRPRVEVALYLSRESWAIVPAALDRTLALARVLRDAADLDFVTRRSVRDGHLRSHRILVLVGSPVLEPAAAAAIESWVRAGGTLLAVAATGEGLGSRLYDNSAWRVRALAVAPPGGEIAVPSLRGAAPAHWVLNVGSETDQRWLTGDWNGRELAREWPEVPGATMRWSGGRSGVLLPVQPGADHIVRLSLSAPRMALGQRGIDVRVNGQPVTVIRHAGKQELEFRLPASLVGPRTVARLEFSVEAWRPSQHEPGSRDSRRLGFSLRHVEVLRGGMTEPPAPAELTLAVDQKRLEVATRTLGRGRTVLLEGQSTEEVAAVLASLLVAPVDGKLDGRFATVTADGVLWFDQKQSRIWKSGETR
ncbi:MAG: beta-galactosidase [Isosphaeraceae bacterium]